MDTPQSFLEKHKGFVLKLRLVGVGGSPQIRRIRLPRIAVGGDVSFDALVAVAISYTFPDAPLTPEDYEVALTYYDVDNDCVTIASTEELLDAISQFSDVLRITTDVRRKKNRPIPPMTATIRRPSRGDMDEDTPPPRHLQNIMESFVGILATAVVALQTHMNPASPVADSSPVAEAASRASGTATVPSVAAAVNETETTAASTETPAEGKKEPKEEAPRPFIHGRHTCDRCLCTPIIGERFHATNLPDYDLCAKCKDGYKGDEIQFEVVELDRDRPFQDRWHRKRERFAAAARCSSGPRGAGGGRRGGGPNRRGPGGPNRGPMNLSGPNRCGPRGRGRFGPNSPGRAGRVARAEQMDDALKEAIRRSLQDVNKDTVEDQKKPAVSKEEPKPTAPVEVELSPPTEEDFKPSAPVDTDVKIEEPDRSESFSVDAVGNGDVAQVLGQTLDQCVDAIDAMVKEINRSASATAKKAADDSKPAAEVVVNESVEEDEPEIAVVETVADDAASVEMEETANAGATILDPVGVEESSVRSAQSEDEWQVVSDDEEKVDDEILARAAQVIGSALFESDNLSRGDDSSFTGGGDGASFLSSVPTITSDSGVPTAVLDQWAAQLIQLRELGFTDDAASVDVLERLHAANIGSDSTDEITVERVVNELLKKN